MIPFPRHRRSLRNLRQARVQGEAVAEQQVRTLSRQSMYLPVGRR